MTYRVLSIPLFLILLISCDPCEEFDFSAFNNTGNPKLTSSVEHDIDIVVQKEFFPQQYQDTITINTFNFPTLILPNGDPENAHFTVYSDVLRNDLTNGNFDLDQTLTLFETLEIYEEGCILLQQIQSNEWDCRVNGALVPEGLYGFKIVTKILLPSDDGMTPHLETVNTGKGIFKVAHCYNPVVDEDLFLPSEVLRFQGLQTGGVDANACP